MRSILESGKLGGMNNVTYQAAFIDDSVYPNVNLGSAPISITGVNLKANHTDFRVNSDIMAALTAVATANGITVPSSYKFMDDADVVTSSADGLMTAADKIILNNLSAGTAQSYQTIVSQTGTSAPAVSGGLTPVNTYSGSPTFTWSRTGAGVYTLTASAAVFNTSGKTGIFIQPLTNLNANVKGIVTSSTVITITTAVQSVAILGLLGLTATPTDVLLDKTMIYIQTYA